MTLISVVIPVYNGGKTIKDTIESVLNQTFKDFELIVVNDGSKDSTLEIIASIQDPRIKVFSYPNGGLSASRNRGIAQASGEYISFIDADDLWTSDKLEFQLKALEENPQAVLAYSWINCINERSEVFGPGSYTSVKGDVYPNLLLINFLECGSNALIRTKAFSEVGGFDESLTSSEDWDMWLRLAARYPFAVVPSPQVLYRVYTTSMSSNVLRMEAETMQVIERAFTQAPKSIQKLKNYSISNFYKYLIIKALEGEPSPKKGLTAARFLWHIVEREPVFLKKRVAWKVLLKAAIFTFLPPKPAEKMLINLKRLADINTLFIHIRRNP